MISSVGSISTASIGMQALGSLRSPGYSQEIKPVEKVIRRDPPEDPFDSGEEQEEEDSEQLLRDLGRSAPRQVIHEVREEAKPEAACEANCKAATNGELTQEEQKQVDDLRQRDRKVRQHEAAHQAAAGQYGGGPTYTFQTGPDGKRYAVGGEVSIDTSAVDGDPQATIAKMQQIQRAAQAPAEPSSQDRQVAAQASQAEQKARAELAEQHRAEQSGESEAEQTGRSILGNGSRFANMYDAVIGARGEASSDESLDLVA